MRVKVMGGVAVVAAACAVYAAPAQAADNKCTVDQLLELPVTMEGRQPTVPVTINGHQTRLLADSGAFFSTVPEATAREYGLKLSPAPFGFYMEGIGGTADVKLGTAQDFKIGRLALHRAQFIVGGSAAGGAGLIGQNLLGFADVEYDLAHGAIRLMRPEHCAKDQNLAYWAQGKPVSIVEIDELDQFDKHTEGVVVLNGVKLRALFDTGASTTMLTKHAAARVGFKTDGPDVKEDGYTEGLGRHVVQTWLAKFDSLAIGDNETIKNIRLRVGDIGDSDDSWDMLIGADFFLSHRVYVSNKLHRMYFSYNGGPVFDLSIHHDVPAPDKALAADGGDAPTTAEGYAGRGNAFAARHEYARARDDLTHAIALAPADAEYRYQRAKVEMALKDEDAAAADLDGALKLSPDDASSLLLRAWLRLDREDKAGALSDAEAADRVLAPQNGSRMELANLYESLDRYDRAIASYGQWIEFHGDDSDLPEALNDRCWLRALSGVDLDDAIHDCSRAMHLRPHSSDIIDSRGWANLRAGKLKDAIDDYDDALKLEPKLASSLYGRGVARRRLGEKVAGDKDIAAAKAIDPDVATIFTKHGITG
ncbi:MAG: aspartyl protease family protein [Sphingomonas sp.]